MNSATKKAFLLLRGWKPFEPSWLVAAAQAQHPEEPWLSEALAQCTLASSRLSRRTIYLHFVPPGARPNKPGSQWQFVENKTLEDTEHGDIVIDVLTDKRVGGIEFLSRVLRRARA